MISIVAIIAEFNPLHEGHKYIIGQARELTGCDRVLVIMSGNLVQRAEPAIEHKSKRAVDAINAGADAVVEIPTVFATGNAEVFAKAAVQIAASFSAVTHLVFGVEGDVDVATLRSVAGAVDNVKPYARAQLIRDTMPDLPINVIDGGNNKLGVEYLRELARLGSNIEVVCVPRVAGASATAVRADMRSAGLGEVDWDKFGAVALYSMMTAMDADKTYNCNEEIYNMIGRLRPVTYEALKRDAPTRRYGVSRIARLALHSALGVTKRDVGRLYRRDAVPYVNLLAIRDGDDELLRWLCANKKTPVVVRGNKNQPRDDGYTRMAKKIDHRADLLWEAVSDKKSFSKKARGVAFVSE